MVRDWEYAALTPTGVHQISKRVEEIGKNFTHLYHSPLIRTQQTATPFLNNTPNIFTQQLEKLAEIFIKPPNFPKWVRLSIRSWIVLCIIKSLLTLSIIKYLKEARHILKQIGNNDSLIISHQARILSILMYCLISRKWKIVKINLKPAGLSIIKKRN